MEELTAATLPEDSDATQPASDLAAKQQAQPSDLTEEKTTAITGAHVVGKTGQESLPEPFDALSEAMEKGKALLTSPMANQSDSGDEFRENHAPVEGSMQEPAAGAVPSSAEPGPVPSSVEPSNVEQTVQETMQESAAGPVPSSAASLAPSNVENHATAQASMQESSAAPGSRAEEVPSVAPVVSPDKSPDNVRRVAALADSDDESIDPFVEEMEEGNQIEQHEAADFLGGGSEDFTPVPEVKADAGGEVELESLEHGVEAGATKNEDALSREIEDAIKGMDDSTVFRHIESVKAHQNFPSFWKLQLKNYDPDTAQDVIFGHTDGDPVEDLLEWCRHLRTLDSGKLLQQWWNSANSYNLRNRALFLTEGLKLKT